MNSVVDYVDTAAKRTAASFNITTGEVELIVGGNIGAGEVERSSWIQVTGGQYRTIAGGNHAAFGGGAGSFTGDSHILVNQAAEGDHVQYIIGGNYQDADSPTFTGCTYISVYTNTLTGSVIGGSTSAHGNHRWYELDYHEWSVYEPCRRGWFAR